MDNKFPDRTTKVAFIGLQAKRYISPPWKPMTEGDVLTPQELQDAARNALEETRVSQSDAARALDVSRTVVSKALNLDDPQRYVKALRGIVKEYTDFTVSDVPRYEVQKK